MSDHADLFVPLPDAAFVVRDHGTVPEPAPTTSTGFAAGPVRIDLSSARTGLTVTLEASGSELLQVGLRWNTPLPDQFLVVGDAWERSYGDLQWRHRQPERVLPWSWLAHDPVTGQTVGMGVRVRPAAFCSWSLDEDGITLWLDVSSGGSPVRLCDRRLEAATIVRLETTGSAYEAQVALCGLMCDDPLLPDGPLVGANNWYYAYGVNFGPEEVLTDARTIVELTDGHPVRPFSVVDAGWSVGGVAPGGPWTEGIPGRFDDMPGLADRIRAEGARPGIWMRPAALTTVDDPARLRQGPRPADEQPLDLSRPDNLERIGADIARLSGWGFELIDADLKAAVRIALDGGEPGGIEPLDWLHSTSPRRWRIGAGERSYRWLEPYGAGAGPG